MTPPIIIYSIAPINPYINSEAIHIPLRLKETSLPKNTSKKKTTLERTAVKNQDKNDILPESPILAPIITATKGGIIIASNENIPIIKSGAKGRKMPVSKADDGVI